MFCLQALLFKKAIEDMAASSLRCIAIAYRSYEMDKVPVGEEELSRWSLPEDDLVLLAIIGLKVLIPFEITLNHCSATFLFFTVVFFFFLSKLITDGFLCI